MKEIKITIPDNCELIKGGDFYIIKNKNAPPRSWEEFCKKYSATKNEFYINSASYIVAASSEAKRRFIADKNYYINKEEAESFLALMQLRQLKKVWVGDWKQGEHKFCGTILYNTHNNIVEVAYNTFCRNACLSFPSVDMVKDFFSCFKDLCETAKILL